ncbi:hypothetical protein HDV05_006906 [Chytridiales sp. JEL 0842]|nr:hypothetical protein HDV05_006906 [Chytridiales sp. JEL 0842]
MASFQEEDNTLQLPASLANALKSAAQADMSAEGDSPPPSRPAPQSKRRRQIYKSTENVSRYNHDMHDAIDRSADDVDVSEDSPHGTTHNVSATNRQRPQTGSKSGWGDEGSNEGLGTSARRGRRAAQARDSEPKDIETEKDVDIDDSSPRHSRKPGTMSKENGVMIVIPDITDVEDDEMMATVAAPPSLKVNRVRTIRDLDSDLASSTGLLNETALSGIDLSLLTSVALCPPDQVLEEDKHWDWDVLFTEVAWLFIGVVGTVLAHTLHTRSRIKPAPRVIKEEKVVPVKGEDGKSPLTLNESLGELAKSTNVNLSQSAVQILLDRAMSDTFFPNILLQCWNFKDPDMQQKALETVQQLSKNDSNGRLLVRWGVLKMLVYIISTENTETNYRNAMVTLYRLMLNKPKRKQHIVRLGAFDPPLLRFLTSYPTHSNDLKYWSLLAVHQLCMLDELQPYLVKKGLIPVLATMTRVTFGNSNMQKYCIHSLVRLLSGLEAEDIEKQLTILLEHNMPSLIVACLRNEDMELVSWSLFLMQDFVVKDFARDAFCATKGLAKILLSLASVSDTVIPRVTLRIMKCLGMKNEPFQRDCLRSGGVKRALQSMKSQDLETKFWALAFLHDIIGLVEAQEEFFQLKGLEILVDLSTTASLPFSLYLSDIFVLLCGTGRYKSLIMHSDILEAVMYFGKSDEADLQYTACLLLLNLSTFSDSMIQRLVDNDCVDMLSDFLLSSIKEDIRIVSAKTLSTIARKDASTRDLILFQTLHPLIGTIVKYVSRGDMAGELSTAVEVLFIFFQPNLLSVNSPPTFTDLKIEHQPLCEALMDMAVLPLLQSPGDEDMHDCIDFWDEDEVCLVDRMNRVKSMILKYMSKFGGEDTRYILDMEKKDALAVRSLNVILSLYGNELFAKFFESERITSLLITLIRVNRKHMSHQALECLAIILRLGLQKSHLIKIPSVMNTILSYVLFHDLTSTQFYGRLLFDYLSDYTPRDLACSASQAYVQPDLKSITPYLFVSKANNEVRNDSWTFESVRATIGVTKSGKYGFEVQLHTDGIIQLGWATNSCSFDAERGDGVGDDQYSYSYDGNRCKKWHVPIEEKNSYGTVWSPGDIITILLDLDKGQITYLQNGENLGVAFDDVDKEEMWYPSLSLASGQGCTVFFGSKVDPVRYLPEGFLTMEAFQNNLHKDVKRDITFSPVKECTVSPLPSDSPSEESDGSAPWLEEINTKVKDAPPSVPTCTEFLSDLCIPVDESFKWDLPEFYYEVQLGLHPSSKSTNRWQLGLRDTIGTVYMITPISHSKGCILKITDRDPETSEVFDALHETLDFILKEEENKFESNGSVQVLGILENFDGKDSDVFGCGYVESTNCVCFTQNGVPLGVVVQGEMGTSYFPYLRNIPRFSVNYGRTTFQWYSGVKD